MTRTNRRAGAIVPLTALGLTALLGIVALCIDLSLVALAKTQCQNAADVAAMAAARSLNGQTTNNNNAATAFTNGKAAATSAYVLGKVVGSSETTIQIGTFNYNSSSGSFTVGNLTSEAAAGTTPNYSPPSGSNWGMAQAQVGSNV